MKSKMNRTSITVIAALMFLLLSVLAVTAQVQVPPGNVDRHLTRCARSKWHCSKPAPPHSQTIRQNRFLP